LGGAIAKDRVEWDDLVLEQARERTPETVRQPRQRVIERDNDDASGADQARDGAERPSRVGRVVQAPEREDHVEGAGTQARAPEVGLDERDALDGESPRGVAAEGERGALEVGADDEPVGGGEKKAHLAGAAADLEDAGIARDRGVERTRELAAGGAR